MPRWPAACRTPARARSRRTTVIFQIGTSYFGSARAPSPVSTQNPRYNRGLDVSLKSVRAANYIRSLRRDLLKVSEAIGVVHPGLIGPRDVDLRDGTRSAVGLAQTYGYDTGWPRLGPHLVKEIEAIMVAQDATNSTERPA